MRIINILGIILFSLGCFAQQSEIEDLQVEEVPQPKERICLTFGVFQGGGALVGADLEVLVSDRVGIQAGAGIRGYGAAVNYHLKESIRSSFLSLTYWHQGFGEFYSQSVMGPTFVYRGKKFLTAQLGIGFALDEGPAWPNDIMEQPPVMLLYSVGIYLPSKK